MGRLAGGRRSRRPPCACRTPCSFCARSSAIEPTPTMTAVRSASRLCSTRFQRCASCVANRSRMSRTKCSMKMKASSDICGPWKPRAAASVTCFRRFGSAWMWSVPVVSAWIKRSFGIAVDQLGEDLVGADDQDVGAGAFRQRLGRVACGMEAQRGQRGASRSAKNAASRPLIRTSDGIAPSVIIGCQPFAPAAKIVSDERLSGSKVHATTTADRTRHLPVLLSRATAPAQPAEDIMFAYPNVALTFSAAYLGEDRGFFAKNGLKVKGLVIAGPGADQCGDLRQRRFRARLDRGADARRRQGAAAPLDRQSARPAGGADHPAQGPGAEFRSEGAAQRPHPRH